MTIKAPLCSMCKEVVGDHETPKGAPICPICLACLTAVRVARKEDMSDELILDTMNLALEHPESEI